MKTTGNFTFLRQAAELGSIDL